MINVEEKIYWIWLSLIKGLGSIKKQKLLDFYKTPREIYEAKQKDLLKIPKINSKDVENILNRNNKNQVYMHIEYMQKNNIDIITIEDKNYPQSLKLIYDMPISLYIKGNKEILNNKSIAIVGCRDASEYGKKASKYFSYNLSKKGINIISGLAKGIDSYAHLGNIIATEEEKYLKRKKLDKKVIDKQFIKKLNVKTNANFCAKTIAVVGNGLDNIYPKENKKLEEKIIKSGGAIISEYPLGSKPEKMNFPARNRIISGMSKGVLVIEAKEKSGTLITVDYALEQGKDVYVIPGNINSITSVGTNSLIKQGAKMVTRYEEIE